MLSPPAFMFYVFALVVVAIFLLPDVRRSPLPAALDCRGIGRLLRRARRALATRESQNNDDDTLVGFLLPMTPDTSSAGP
jgi:hypothetical protein